MRLCRMAAPASVAEQEVEARRMTPVLRGHSLIEVEEKNVEIAGVAGGTPQAFQELPRLAVGLVIETASEDIEGRTGATGAISQSLVMLGAVVVTVPALWCAWVALTDDIESATLALWAGLAAGFGVLIIGVTAGSMVFSRRGGRLMEFAEST